MIVDDLSRLARDEIEPPYAARRLRSRGIRIISTTESIDTDAKAFACRSGSAA